LDFGELWDGELGVGVVLWLVVAAIEMLVNIVVRMEWCWSVEMVHLWHLPLMNDRRAA
jgi:hypothetical protein